MYLQKPEREFMYEKKWKEIWCMTRNGKRIDVWKEIQRWLMYENKYKDNLCMESNKR